LNAKVAVLLALTLFAFGLLMTTTFNSPTPRLYAVTHGVTEYDAHPPQPAGDPIDGGGPAPHGPGPH
jgi:hypothetical protein